MNISIESALTEESRNELHKFLECFPCYKREVEMLVNGSKGMLIEFDKDESDQFYFVIIEYDNGHQLHLAFEAALSSMIGTFFDQIENEMQLQGVYIIENEQVTDVPVLNEDQNEEAPSNQRIPEIVMTENIHYYLKQGILRRNLIMKKEAI